MNSLWGKLRSFIVGGESCQLGQIYKGHFRVGEFCAEPLVVKSYTLTSSLAGKVVMLFRVYHLKPKRIRALHLLGDCLSMKLSWSVGLSMGVFSIFNRPYGVTQTTVCHMSNSGSRKLLASFLSPNTCIASSEAFPGGKFCRRGKNTRCTCHCRCVGTMANLMKRQNKRPSISVNALR